MSDGKAVIKAFVTGHPYSSAYAVRLCIPCELAIKPFLYSILKDNTTHFLCLYLALLQHMVLAAPHLYTSSNIAALVAETSREPAAAPMHRRGHSTGSMHQRQLSAGTAVELGRAFDSLLSAAPTKGTLGAQWHTSSPNWTSNANLSQQAQCYRWCCCSAVTHKHRRCHWVRRLLAPRFF